MGETTTTSSTEPEAAVTRGFKYLNRYARKTGATTTDPKADAVLQSGYDASEWAIGEWRSVAGSVRACRNGFHMSQTPGDARQYVNGNVLALVEGRGDVAEDSDKTAHREMRVIAWWPHAAADKLRYDDQDVASLIDPAVRQAYEDAQAAYSGAWDVASRDAVKAYEAAISEPKQAYEAAVREPQLVRDLEHRLARAEREYARAVADAEYSVRVARADAALEAAISGPEADYQAAKAAASAVKMAAERAAQVAYDDAKNEASAVYAAGREAAKAGLVPAIMAKLGKPSATAKDAAL